MFKNGSDQTIKNPLAAYAANADFLLWKTSHGIMNAKMMIFMAKNRLKPGFKILRPYFFENGRPQAGGPAGQEAS